MLLETTLRRLLLARYLYNLAEDNARSHREVASFAAINLLQDAVEMCLICSVDHLNVRLSKKSEFETYIDKVNDQLTEKIPYRQRLIELNKVRVLSKHNGVRPNSTEISGYIVLVRSFFDEATPLIFGRPFWSLSLVELLDNDETKGLLQEAERKFHAGEYIDCLIECRKALYVEYEWHYDIQAFKEQPSRNHLFNALAAMGNYSPLYAKNHQYIQSSVKDPFDYIVYDYARMDAELVSEGIDPGIVANIRRLTPSVYRHKKEEEWLVKYEPVQFELEDVESRAAYVLENSIDVVLKKTMRSRSLRYMPHRSSFEVFLKNDAPIFEKADDQSKLVGAAPKSYRFLNATFGTPGLGGNGYFWRVYFETKDQNPSFIVGYVRDIDTVLNEAEIAQG